MTTRRFCYIHARILPVIFAALTGFSTLPSQGQAAEVSGFAPIVIEKASAARQLALLQAICEAGQVGMQDDVPVCSACPSYTAGGSAGLRITNVISGNFTRSGASEILVDTAGCEPASANGGGSVLLEAGEGGWTRTLYRAGFRSNECIRFRTIAQTAAVACNMSHVDGGVQRGTLAWLNLRAAKPVQHELLAWYDNSRSNPRQLVSVFPHRFMKSDFNSDGRVDLQVTVRLREETVPEQYPDLVEAMAAGHRLKAEKSLRLIYLFDGSTLVLAPGSEDNKARIDALLETTRDH